MLREPVTLDRILRSQVDYNEVHAVRAVRLQKSASEARRSARERA